MTKGSMSKIGFFLFIALFAGSASAYALGNRELQSGGSFFESKGTKAAEGYEESEQMESVYQYGRGLDVGTAHVKPSISYSRVFEDNVFLEEDNTDDDWVNRINVDIAAEQPLDGGRHLLTLGYFGNFEYFDDFDEQDHTDHAVYAGLDLNFVPFTFNIRDTFQRTTDRGNTEFTTRVSREENTLSSLLEIPFASFFLETELFDLDIRYRAPEQEIFDHNDLDVFQRIGFDIAPSTQLLGEYGYKNIDYEVDNGRDGQAHQISAGLRGRFTERMTYQAWVGGQFREYDDTSRPEFNGFVSRGALQFDMSETSQIILKGDRSPQESTFDGQSFYVRNRGELLWKQQIAERLYFRTRGILQFNKYSRDSVFLGVIDRREDWVWETGFGLEYQMPNEIVSIFAEYRFTQRDSNLPTLSYDGQVIDLGVRAAF